MTDLKRKKNFWKGEGKSSLEGNFFRRGKRGREREVKLPRKGNYKKLKEGGVKPNPGQRKSNWATHSEGRGGGCGPTKAVANPCLKKKNARGKKKKPNCQILPEKKRERKTTKSAPGKFFCSTGEIPFVFGSLHSRKGEKEKVGPQPKKCGATGVSVLKGGRTRFPKRTP